MYALFGSSEGNDTGERMLKRLFMLLILLPLLGIIGMCLAFLGFGKGFDFLITLGYGLLIGGAAYLVGGLVGFMFGLPRMLTNPDQPSADYSRNDNLIQISDWVTKIIVGLGLTNLYEVPTNIIKFGNHYGGMFGVNGPLIAEFMPSNTMRTEGRREVSTLTNTSVKGPASINRSQLIQPN